MKYKISAIAIAAAFLASCGQAEKKAEEVVLTSGVDSQWLSETVRPQDHYDDYVNAKWTAQATIPDDMVAWGGFMTLFADTEKQVQKIVEMVATPTGADGERGQLERFYASFMDEEGREAKGMAPVMPVVDMIGAVTSKHDVMMLTTDLRTKGISTFFSLGVGQDDKNATQYTVFVGQGGTGLPDKSYYFNEGEKFDTIRVAYPKYIASLLKLAGIEDADAKAEAINAMEYKIAGIQWDRVDRRDSEKTYNPSLITDLDGSYEMGFAWSDYLQKAGVHDIATIIVSHPSFFEGIGTIIAETDVETLKAYLQYRAIRESSTSLNQAAYDIDFDFQSRLLNGQEEQPAKWKQAVRTLNNNMGDAVGKLYVEEYFPPRAKAKMEKLVNNLIDTFGVAIDNLEWMSDETKAKAQEKRNKFTYKIGYPDVWKDRSAIVINADDYHGNILRVEEWEYADDMAQLGGPINRYRWGMNPQTVNAYNNSSLNEIVFPAAILQPPFFDMNADDAVNYGGIGAVIGHEIGHAFDDQGRKYDGDGNMVDWWTEEDAKAFDVRAAKIIEQYKKYEILPDLYVKGEMTIGEDIGDFTGISIAYQAYKKSLGGKEAPVIDGLTGDERFFLGWGQIWRSMQREDYKRRLQTVDVHSPDKARIMIPMKNFQGFYDVYGLQEGDGMYLPPEERVKIW